MRVLRAGIKLLKEFFVSGLRLSEGDMLQIDGPAGALKKVVRRGRQGIWVEPHGSSDEPQFLADKLLIEKYGQRKLRHWPANLSHLDEVKMERLKVAFSAWPAAFQREAARRLSFVSDMRMQIEEGIPHGLAAVRSAKRVFDAFHQEWDQEERDASLKDEARRWRRKGESADCADPKFKKCKRPAPSTIQKWFRVWAECGFDCNALIPGWDRKGNRKLRLSTTSYRLAKQKIDQVYMTRLRPKVSVVYRAYRDECEELGLAHDDIMSERSFHSYIRKLYTDEHRCRVREGPKAAWMKFGLIAEQSLPNLPLEEVEIDHCLVDVILTWNGRPCGRPWITVLLDRATKCVIGVHITFHPPSYQSVRMALLHAAFPKDLSGFPEIKKEWPCFGAPTFLISDQGKEFQGRHYLSTCQKLNITPIRLKGRSPWLKGAIERLFGVMNVDVFDLMEGATKFQNVEAYDSVQSARLDKSEFTSRLLKWIVDRYHYRPHSRLEKKYGKGATPAFVWNLLTDQHGLSFVSDTEKLVSLTAKRFQRKIARSGISIGSQKYLDKELLKELRGSPGGTTKQWTVLQDDTDWGHIRLIDDRGPVPRTLVIPNHDADFMAGVSAERFAIILDEARQMTPASQAVSIETLRRARASLDDQTGRLLEGTSPNSRAIRNVLRWARYGETNAPVTPLPISAYPPANDCDVSDERPQANRVSAPSSVTKVEEDSRPRPRGEIEAMIAQRLQKMSSAS